MSNQLQQAEGTIVKLRTFKLEGTRPGVHLDESGNILNDNQLVTLPYGRIEWFNYLKNIKVFRFTKVVVEKMFVPNKKETGYKEAEKKFYIPVQQEVDDALTKKPETLQTPEQIELAAMRDELAAMRAERHPISKGTSQIDEELVIEKNRADEEAKLVSEELLSAKGVNERVNAELEKMKKSNSEALEELKELREKVDEEKEKSPKATKK